jgi:4'-phosphopantetheinyl transferase
VEAGENLHLARWRTMLDPEEVARADRYHFAVDRDSYTAAHALVRFMLSKATGLSTKAWRYVVGEFGKPALAADLASLNLHFSISHTNEMIACAIARDEVGVDVERLQRTIDLSIVQHFFAPEEVWLLNSVSPDQQVECFIRFWTLKEAFIKATGEGMGRPLDSFSFSLDPVHITFHHRRNKRSSHENEAKWRFWEWRPANEFAVALAMRATGVIRVDAGPAWAADIGPL